LPVTSGALTGIQDNSLKQTEPLYTIIDLLRRKIGLDAIAIGYSSLTNAIRYRMMECGLQDASSYLVRIQTSPQELDALIEQIVVPETWFFRDREPFIFLVHYIQSEWIPKHCNRVLRILSLPCATGEEPYSIAIALIEAGLPPKNFQIDAVDISKQAINRAKQAVYDQNSFRGGQLPLLNSEKIDRQTGLQERYFKPVDHGYQVNEWITKTVKFIHGNLLDPCFLADQSSYDILFCRNLLIYLTRSAREQAIQISSRLLTDQGLLFVGHSEMGQLPATHFAPVHHAFAFAARKKRQAVEMTGQGWTKVAEVQTGKAEQETTERVGRRDREHSWLADKSLTPHSPTPSPTKGEGEPERLDHFQSPSLALGEEFRVRAKDFCQSTSVQSSVSLLEAARTLADQGQLQDAIMLCEMYLKHNRIDAEAYLLLGQIYQAGGNEEQAEQYFQKVIYLQPNHEDALMHLRLLKENRRDFAGADVIQQRIQRLQKPPDQ